MNKVLYTILFALALVGCEGQHESAPQSMTGAVTATPGLQDCSYHEVKGPNVLDPRLRIVRCPSSSTTTQYANGKAQLPITTIDPDLDAARAKVRKADQYRAAVESLTPEQRTALGLPAQP